MSQALKLQGFERFQLTPKQSNIYQWGWQDSARFRFAVCGRRFGKALGLETKLPTPFGWTTMGEVKPGDVLFDENGQQCRVVFATDVMLGRPCYRVKLSDNTEIIADEEHLWLTWDRCARKNIKRNTMSAERPRIRFKPVLNASPKVRSTMEILNSISSGSRGDTNHSIQTCLPIECTDVDLPVPPYVFGAWLGDGTSVNGTFTCNDPQIIDEILKEGQSIKPYPKTGPYGWKFDGDCRGEKRSLKSKSLQSRLGAMGQLGNKHIPIEYLRGSVPQRLALLQGLMDTDGTASKGGACEFTGTNKRLVEDFLHLARSLGIRAVWTEGVAKLNGRFISAKYRVTFTTEFSVFRLQRKRERLQSRFGSKRNIDHRFILSVTPCESVPVRCIQVDSPNRLYLCSEAFVVTHNTFLIREEILRAAKFAMTQGVPEQNEIWYGAPTFKQAKRVFWKLLKKSIPRQWLERGRWNETDHCGTLLTGHVIRIVGLDNYDDLRGSGLFFFVGDEWDDAQPECWSEVVRPMLSTSNGHAIFIGSPKGFSSLHDGYVKGQPGGDSDTKSWKYTTLEGGNVPQDEIERARRELDPRTFRQEYEAGFETFAGQVYYSFNRRESVRPCPYNPSLPLHIGMDFNVNPMTATIWQGQANGDDWQVGEIEIPTSDTVTMSDEIIRRFGKSGFDPSKPDLSHITIYPDPAGAQRRTSAQGKTDIGLLWEKGFIVKALSSHPLVRDRVNIMNSRLLNAAGVRRSFVDPSCRRSIECLERQTYKEGTSEPDKDGGFDHMCFAGDVLVDTSDGDIAFKDLPANGYVRTWNGKYVPYVLCGKIKDKASLVELTFDDGSSVKCTPDHRFLTSNGWKEAIDLSDDYVYDWLFFLKESQCKSKSSTTNAKSSMASDIIFAENTFKRRVKEFIGLCGNISTGQFLPNATFTTSTTIDQTMMQAISKCLNLRHIINTTWLRQNANQALIMPKEAAKCVVNYLPQTSILKWNRAVTPVLQNCDGKTVVKILQTKNEDVYCLTVPGHGCFALANGLIVKNCDASGYMFYARYGHSPTFRTQLGYLAR